MNRQQVKAASSGLRRPWSRVLMIAVLLMAAWAILASAAAGVRAAFPGNAVGGPGAPNTGVGRGPILKPALHSDVSPPLRNIAPIPPAVVQGQEGPENPFPALLPRVPVGPDPALQRVFGPLAMPPPGQTFAGQGNLWAVFPPDTDGDVGRNEYVQIVNLGFQIFSKTGTALYGPANNNTLWTGFGGLCESTNRGDAIALYDPLADRWLLSQFALDPANGTDTHQCFALSTSPDPLGSYYRYDFHTSPTAQTIADYPKLGVWPDAYYMTTNEFVGSTSVGGGAFAFDRIKMLQGDPSAAMIYFHDSIHGLLPSDLDGPPPPAGNPNYFLGPGTTNTQLQEFKFHADFAHPPNSTFSGPTAITVPAYNLTICTEVYRSACVDQPNTPVKLETVNFVLAYRLQYRNFPSDHETLIVNHTVNATGGNPGLAGIRWYEIRNPMTSTVAYQAGTYQAADGSHAWMASAAMDRQGDLAVGFSASSTTVYPSIRYVGRLAGDPLNTLAQGEQTLMAGGGSQLWTQNPNDGRWGDYSMLAVDPTDDCTFWYTSEYIPQNTLFSWRTRIASFKFPNCSAPGKPTPVPSATGTPPTVTTTPTAEPTLCPGGPTVTGAITNSDPIQNGQMYYAGVPSSCDAPKTCPTIVVLGPIHYDPYTFSNTSGSAQCVTVTLDARACQTSGLESAAYLTSYDPANPCLNYLADAGRFDPVESYSFLVPAGATYVVVVNEYDANAGCALYHLTVNPCAATPPFTATATPGPVTLSATATASATPACGAAPPWQAGPTLRPATYNQTGITASDGNFYVAGGFDTLGSPLNRVTRFNAGTNAWDALPTMPVPVAEAGMAAPVSGQVYVAGGALRCRPSCTLTNTVQIYDIGASSWRFGPSVPRTPGMETAATAGDNGKLYIFGGDDGASTVFTSTYILNTTTETWTLGAPLPIPLSGAAATAVGGIIYVYGGASDFAGTQTSDGLYAYDPAANTWMTLEHSGDPEFLAGLSTYDAGRLLVTGGGHVVGGQIVSTAATHIYNIAAHSWTVGPPLLSERAAHAQDRLPDGRVIVAAGIIFESNTILGSSELLAPPPPCATATATGGPPTATATHSTPIRTATRVASPTAVSATSTATPCAITFSDVHPTDYFYAPVRYLYCRGVISGYADNTFRPYADTTRGQLVKIVVLGLGIAITTPAAPTFSDVPASHPFYAYIETAAARGIVSGYADGTFRPQNNVTRGQLSKIAVGAANWPLRNPSRPTFTDVAPGSAFYPFVETAVCHGVVSGYADGTFRPGANATRGQISKIVYLAMVNPPTTCAATR